MSMRKIFLLMIACWVGGTNISVSQEIKKNEDYYNNAFGKKLGAAIETIHFYSWQGQTAKIRVDIETTEYVIEGGLDKRSSLDSVQQALFASSITGKKPAVVIYDTDGQQGKYEYRIRIAAELAGVKFVNISEDDIRNTLTIF